ncbi:anthranilate synthase component II [Idiomarina xiamenensis]|uniref:anthranilate synthase n=1 Tax=Idiomarina xiamenensis 10-D-4 TaxID=740709 RepID=K2JLG0_9GAMM|nr:glutamine amidotransferase [Idiomarina xiamenensis]EKE84311.1 anthranilate synthase component II [Idiomarina xiamenensis 10-D-4]
MSQGRIILIDNQDSFAYNLVDELRQLGYQLLIYRNQVSVETLAACVDDYADPQLLCLSPGPGHPQQAGQLLAIIKHFRGKLPMLGICLGLQALLVDAGARVDRCGEIVHGKVARVDCVPHPLFEGLIDDLSDATTATLSVARYHSLSGYDLPSSAQVLASIDGPQGRIPMAVYFSQQHSLGFQFHPESIMTTAGSRLLKQSVQMLLAAPSTTPSGAISCSY